MLLLPTWSIVHSRVLEGADPVPGAPLPRASPSTAAATVARTGRSEPEAYTTSEFAADAIAVMDATATDRAALVALSCGALWATIARRRSPRAGRSASSTSRRPSRSRPTTRSATAAPLRRRRSTTERGLGEVQPPLLAPGLPRLPRVLLRQVLQRAALDASRSRTASAGRSRPTPETLIDTTRGIGIPREETVPADLRPRALPDARDPRRRDLVRPHRAGRGARARDRRRRS